MLKSWGEILNCKCSLTKHQRIYTTALSPADTAAALAAILIVQQEPQRRRQLWANVDELKKLMQLSNLKLVQQKSPILQQIAGK